MTIAYDAFSKSAVGASDLTWTHTPVGTPKGIIVGIMQQGITSDLVTGVTYGGVAMTRVGISTYLQTAETAALYLYFLGSGIPTGAQTVLVETGSYTKRAYCYSVTAAGDTEVNTTTTAQLWGTTSISGTLSLGSVESFCAQVFFNGYTSPSWSQPTGWVEDDETDFGANTGGFARYSTIGTADVEMGGSMANADDMAAYAVAISEIAGGGVTPVDSDLGDAYAIRASVNASLTDTYSIRASIASSLSDLYGILSSVAANLADSYSINIPVSADLADAYNLRQAIAADLADAYALRALAQSDLADAYGIRASVGADLSDLYDILSAGSVSSSLSDAYNIRASIGTGLSDLVNIRAAVASALTDTANIREAVAQQLQDAYTIITSVSADLQDIYNLRQEVVSNLVDAYLVASQPGACPTAEDIAAAVLAAAQSVPIHANVKKMNDANVIGAGTSADKWRGA